MSRPMSQKIRASAVALMLFAAAAPVAYAAAPGNLDELLEQTRSQRDREAAANKEREAKFLAERDKQAALLSQAKAELSELQNKQKSLSAAFDSNEKKLTELQAQLDAKSGNMGEMFGVVRQVANDFSSVVRNSMISAQYPDREEFVTKLAATKALPSISDLERFWFELQREMTETGSVVRFKSKVVQPDGSSVDESVSRIGSFTAVADGKYLAYLPSEHKLAVMARQPGGKFQSAASDLTAATSGYVGTELDPTRGVLLTIYAQRPNWIERIKHGEGVNYVILLVGIIGAILGVYQFFYLMGVRGKVKKQLTQIDRPTTDNPLGRVLASFKGDGSRIEEDAEVVELRISEAVLREVPPLERFQAFLRLAVAAGPLLGLIGTVIGMIITFQSITESGSSDPKLMAAGISAAMIATVLGLGIAIPLLFANAWLTSLSKQIIQILDEQSTGLLAERLEGKTGA
ncbi:MotA/TolQ/ExbB proton channel family protein [Hydrocarboniphaga sp.]|uniref:MotA/TolQ/ExbB proton channel family protein n=1 Tax=Hydrocarboniphaga sp. TaxID=2033016 RepID=UPI003D1203F5